LPYSPILVTPYRDDDFCRDADWARLYLYGIIGGGGYSNEK